MTVNDVRRLEARRRELEAAIRGQLAELNTGIIPMIPAAELPAMEGWLLRLVFLGAYTTGSDGRD